MRTRITVQEGYAQEETKMRKREWQRWARERGVRERQIEIERKTEKSTNGKRKRKR